MHRRLLAGLAAAVLLAGCAARQASTCAAVDGAMAAADALIRRGCYDCLLEARATYERAAVSCSVPALQTRTFETQLLIVLRERELAIDDGESVALAEQLGATLPAPSNAERYLELIRMVRLDSDGTPERDRQPRPGSERITGLVSWLRAAPTQTLLGEYLAGALECELDPPPALPDANATTVPLLMYRRALCGDAMNLSALDQLGTDPSGFPEAAFFAGRALTPDNASADGSAARRFLEKAYARFPKSPAVTRQLAMLARVAGQDERAVKYYAETLALRPRHEDARHGRMIALSHLGRHDEAIADATTLVDEDLDPSGEALYWRAWNHYQRQALPAARADIDRAKTIYRAAFVLTLSGMIGHDQSDFGVARQDLLTARTMDPTYCPAIWHHGVVDFRRQDFPSSARAFVDAAACYEALTVNSEQAIAALAARSDVQPEFRARQLAAWRVELRESRSQVEAAVLNAALNYARAGDREQARVYLERATARTPRPDVAEAVRKLLDR